MRRFRDRAGRLVLLLPLAIAAAVAGCESATGPKFPDPQEEPEDSTIEEGMIPRRVAILSAAHEAALVAAVPSFQPVGSR